MDLLQHNFTDLHKLELPYTSLAKYIEPEYHQAYLRGQVEVSHYISNLIMKYNKQITPGCLTTYRQRIFIRCLPLIIDYYQLLSLVKKQIKYRNRKSDRKLLYLVVGSISTLEERHKFLETIFQIPAIDWDDIMNNNNNYKGQLLEYCHIKLPGCRIAYVSRQIDRTELIAEGHFRESTLSISIAEVSFTCRGKTIKQAEQACAKVALETLTRDLIPMPVPK